MNFVLFSLFLPTIVVSICPSCQQQCPCTGQNSPAQTSCIGFDTRYMAATIDDAMFQFPNLVSSQGKPLFDESLESQKVASSVISGTTPVAAGASSEADTMSIASVQSRPAPYAASIAQPQAPAKSANKLISPASPSSCASQECMSCKLAIIDGFLGNSKESDADTLWVTKVHLQHETGLSSGTCGSVENAPPTTTKRPPKNQQRQNVKRANQILNILTTYGRKKRTIPMVPPQILNISSTTSSSSTSVPPSSTNVTQSTLDTLLGVTTQIGCDYRRGSALTSNAKYTGLCNLCWQWRKLPEEYFPSYVNEVACDSGDCGCLSGFGTCMPVTRVLNVLKNTGTKTNPNWIQVTIDTIAACECQVAMNSPLLSFVSK